MGEEQREHVRVAEADECDRDPEQPDRRIGRHEREDREADGGERHDDAADAHAELVADLLEHDAAGEAADHAGDEVHHRRGGRDGCERVAGVLGQDARRLRVDGDVHAHVRHDAEEAQEHDAVGEQQLEAAADGSGAGVRRGLLDLVEPTMPTTR